MLIHDVDHGEEYEWRAFIDTHRFGELIAVGRGRDVAVVVPTQFLLTDNTAQLHLAARNPIWDAIAENPRVTIAVSGDWAFIPSDWKAIDTEDPRFCIPTTYYASVQLIGTATVHDSPEEIARTLRDQLVDLQPDTDVVDPIEHTTRLRVIRAITIEVSEVRSKFKYGGNVDQAHRDAVGERLQERNGPNDGVALQHLQRRSAE